MEPRPLIHRFGPYEFSPAHLELRIGDERKPLTKSMNRLLLLLVTRPGEVITREQIADTLWSEQGTVDVTNGINTAINRLRSTIGGNQGHGAFIETVVGTGYRFTAPVETVDPPPEVATTRDEPASLHLPEAAKTPPSHIRFSMVVAAALLLTLGGFAWRYLHHPASGTPADRPQYQVEAVTTEDPADELNQQAISPSTRYLAYSDAHGIFLKTLADNTVRPIEVPQGLHITRLSWYPDETTLLVTGSAAKDSSGTPNGSSQLWRLSLLGQAPQLLLAPGEAATVSPDGSRIAFLRAGKTELWLADAMGQAAHRLVQTSNGDTLPYILWTPDSKRLIANRIESDLVRLPVGTNETQQRAPSPSASFYESFDAQTGSRLAEETIKPFESAVLLRDGTLYCNTAPTASEKQQMEVVQTDSATGAFRSAPEIIPNSQLLSSGFQSVEQLVSSADGKTVSAILNRPATHSYLADLVFNGTKPTLQHVTLLSHHTFNTLPMEWTRDGKMILTDEGLGDPVSVVGEMLDGTAARMLVASHDGQHYAQGQHSADGQWLLFLHIYPGGRRTIERIPANGGTPQPIPVAGNASDFRCSISSKGRCVVRVLEENKDILYYELDPSHGTGAVLARTGWRRTVLGDWTISPNGQTLAIANHDPAHPGVELLPLNGTAPREMPVPGYGTVLGISWTVDGHAFFIHTSDPAGYSLLYMAANGEVSFLRRSPDILWAIPSPDGKKVVFPENTSTNRNVWVGRLEHSLKQ